ncbi:MAG: trehalose-6-phosphate synthase [Bryobacteraceae bacterium]
MWTKQNLHDLISSGLRDVQFIVVSNREPYLHSYTGREIVCIQPASGLAAALDPIMRATGGTWIAHGAGSADRLAVDAKNHVAVPPESPKYTLRRVWLTKEQENRYYYGLANEALWPLCHTAFTRPVFRPEDWQCYREVNELFAKAVIEEAGGQPTFVFIQDYHFGLLPRILKDSGLPNMYVAQFWHIPWPNQEAFRAFPWGEELLDGLLGNDVLGFHIGYHCRNFLSAVDRGVEARADMERFEVTRGGHVTAVRPFPISIDFESHSQAAAEPRVEAEMERWRHELGLNDELIVGIGLDRIDYTKGIPERFRAVDRLLEEHPEYRGRLVFVQIGVPSRVHITRYKELNDEIDSLAEAVNWKWSTDSWKPVILLREHAGPARMMALHRLARFCLVSALHDGMNMVAKEFVASRFDEDGVLILSYFAGAAHELTDALLINPFSLEAMTEAIHLAIEMPEAERQHRMHRMRAVVAERNIYNWAGEVISTLLRFDFTNHVDAKRCEATAD